MTAGLPALPRAAERHTRRQHVEVGAALAAVRRQWRRMGPEFDSSYRMIAPTLLAITVTAQERLAAQGQAYVPAVLAETGQTRAVEPVARVRTAPLVGVAGDGRPVESLLEQATVHARVAVSRGASSAQALESAGKWLNLAVGTVLADTLRQSEALAMGVRPVGGYVRMVQSGACSRCVVLAGKWFRKNQGFERHPGCQCVHIPASESVAGDVSVDPAAYFESLTAAEQDRVFTKAGAEAIREGADIAQVVNARRGMRTAQIGGRDVLITTEGTTRFGRASQALGTGSGRRPRLMPETALAVARDRTDFLRLLRANGYL